MVFLVSGAVNVMLIFLLSYRLHHSIIFSLLVASLLLILPWHIFLILDKSPHIFILTAALLIGIFFSKQILKKKVGIFLIFASLIFFFLSTLSIPPYTNVEVDFQRTYASKTPLKKVSSIFSNKIIESYRSYESKLFEDLDIGNYFFTGHPRERGNENPKFYPTMFLFFILGLISLSITYRYFFAGLLISSVIILPELLILPVTYLSALGIDSFRYSKPILALTLLEFIFFAAYLI